ncbi:hypothetical protein JOM56_004354 [Amanita muscaria]
MSSNQTPFQRRRMTSPPDMTRSSLSDNQHASVRYSLYQPESSSNIRPPSPLRNAIVPNTFTGIDPTTDSDDDPDSDIDQDDQQKRNKNHPYQSSSPASSVSQLAASFAQRVGTFVAATRTLSGSSNNHLPTDAELEAEAHRERERSRREAELILTREAEERRMAEEKILAMKESLPPPPSRTQTMSNPPSPSGSPKSKDGAGWWSAAKNKLTPTKDKDPLTPAQQVILEAKARERENQQKKGTDLNLNIPHGPPSRPVPTSPVSPTPSRNQAPNLTPSPMRSNADAAHSPSREAPPLYAQFTPQGTLDVHGTLLTIVKRFEKLEKWTVGHVRALEDRMNDVERWLVDKEMEKEEKSVKDSAVSDSKPQQHSSSSATAVAVAADQNVARELTEMREELNELQDRVGELGREMARTSMTTSPPLPLSSSLPGSVFATPHTPHHPRLSSTTARESTSPPMAVASKHTGTRFPYPTGDYASPPDNLFSPPHSPPGSVNSATWTRSAAATANSNTTNTNTNANTISPNTGPNATTTSTGLFTSTSIPAPSFSSASIPSRPLPASPKSTPSASASTSNSIASLTRVASPPPLPSSHPSSSSLNSLSLPLPPKIPASSSSPSSSPSGSPGGSGRTRKAGKMRQSSVSPTPRKRYTVALGEPIVSREPQESMTAATTVTPSATPVQKRTHSRNQSLVSTASFLSESDAKSETDGIGGGGEQDRDEEENEDEFQDETIGKSSSSRILSGATAANGSTTSNNSNRDAPPSSLLSRRTRVRPQSAYDFSSFLKQHQQPQLQAQTSQQSLQSNQSNQSHHSSHSLHRLGSIGSSGSTPVAPLAIKSRWRSQSTDRGSSSSLSSSGDRGDPVNTASVKFVDPLALRKQERGALPMPKSMGKIPVGDLVAFFDGEKRG